jgi:divalent metal cation (Fe/Co/Zn/Cd) transporter
LIRLLGHSFAVEVNIRLEPEITLEETTKIVDEIQSSIVIDFKTSNTFVIRRPISATG